MSRENGFYWVYHPVYHWEIAEWANGSWCLAGFGTCLNDDSFEQIDENRITRGE